MQQALPSAMQAVRSLGFKVGLHTAGIYPKRLAAVLPLVDWVGFDLKAERDKYAAITGIKNSAESAYHSLKLLTDSGVAFTARTPKIISTKN